MCGELNPLFPLGLYCLHCLQVSLSLLPPMGWITVSGWVARWPWTISTATSVLVIMLIIIVSAISCWFLFQVMKGTIRAEPKVLPCVRTVVPWMVKWAGCLLLHWGMCLSTSGSQSRTESSVLPHPQHSLDMSFWELTQIFQLLPNEGGLLCLMANWGRGLCDMRFRITSFSHVKSKSVKSNSPVFSIFHVI